MLYNLPSATLRQFFRLEQCELFSLPYAILRQNFRIERAVSLHR